MALVTVGGFGTGAHGIQIEAPKMPAIDLTEHQVAQLGPLADALDRVEDGGKLTTRESLTLQGIADRLERWQYPLWNAWPMSEAALLGRRDGLAEVESFRRAPRLPGKMCARCKAGPMEPCKPLPSDDPNPRTRLHRKREAIAVTCPKCNAQPGAPCEVQSDATFDLDTARHWLRERVELGNVLPEARRTLLEIATRLRRQQRKAKGAEALSLRARKVLRTLGPYGSDGLSYDLIQVATGYRRDDVAKAIKELRSVGLATPKGRPEATQRGIDLAAS
jgi:hypothetical protein